MKNNIVMSENKDLQLLVRKMADLYQSQGIEGLFCELMDHQEKDWAVRLYEFISGKYYMFESYPDELLATLIADPISIVPEIGLFLQELTKLQNKPWLRPQYLARESEKPLFTYFGVHNDFIGGLVFVGEDQFISCSEDGYIKLWELKNEEPLREVEGHEGLPVNFACYHREKQILFTCGDDNMIRLWNPKTLEPMGVWEGHEDYVSRLAIADKLLLSTSKDETVGVWDIGSGKMVKKLTGHEDWVYGLAISPDHKRAVTSAINNSLIIWDLSNFKIKTLTEGDSTIKLNIEGHDLFIGGKGENPEFHKNYPPTIRWYNPDTFITAAEDIICWDAETYQIKSHWEGHSWGVKGMVHNNGVMITTANSIKGWDASSGRELFEVIGHDGAEITAAVLTPDGKYLLTGDKEGNIAIREVAKLLRNDYLLGHVDAVKSIVVCDGGARAVTGSYDNTAIIWDLNQGIPERRLKEHIETEVEVFAEGRESKEVITTSRGELHIWDVQDGVRKVHITNSNDLYDISNLVKVGTGFISNSMCYSLSLWEPTSGEVTIINQEHNFYGPMVFNRNRTQLLCTTYAAKLLDGDGDWRDNSEPLHTPLVLFDPEERMIQREFWYPSWLTWLLRRLKAPRRSKLAKLQRYPTACCFSPDESMIAGGFNDGMVVIWDSFNGKLLQCFKADKTKQVEKFYWINDDTLAVFTEKGTGLYCRDLKHKSFLRNIPFSDQSLKLIEESPDGKYWTAVTLYSNQLIVFDREKECILAGVFLSEEVKALAWNGDKILAGCKNGLLYSFEICK